MRYILLFMDEGETKYVTVLQVPPVLSITNYDKNHTQTHEK